MYSPVKHLLEDINLILLWSPCSCGFDRLRSHDYLLTCVTSYGESKLAGEREVLQVGKPGKVVVLRVPVLYVARPS